MRKTRKGEYAWWGSNIPNNVAAGLGPVVQESKTRVGDKIGEAHVCDRESIVVWSWGKVLLWFMTVRSFGGSKLRGKIRDRTDAPRH